MIHSSKCRSRVRKTVGKLFRRFRFVLRKQFVSLQNYRAVYNDINESGLFDANYYLLKYPWALDATHDPLEHYIIIGHRRGYNPADSFETSFYLSQNDDVVQAGVNPFHHYVLHGKDELRQPNQKFDAKYYLENNEDVAQVGIDPYEHYILHGQFEGRLPAADADMYSFSNFLRDNELTVEDLQLQVVASEEFEYRPKITFITPVYHPPISILVETIESVCAQTYSNWQLAISNASVDNKEVRVLLDQYAAKDSRILVKHLDDNFGISGNSNIALESANGEYVALLDHDDLVEPNLLYEVVAELNQDSEADLLYYDEDKINTIGIRNSPFFKPDWSPALLLSANYLTHCVIRRSLVEDVGSFRSEYDGAQDWDLMFRCTEHTTNIVHIPKILYHWRQLEGSTAKAPEEKPWVVTSQTSAIESHLERVGLSDPQAQITSQDLFRVSWQFSEKKVSIIIPTKDNVELLEKCLNSIVNNNVYTNFEIILVDTGSSKETFDYYDSEVIDSRITIVNYPHTEFNYSIANNYGVEFASGDYLLFLNNDTEAISADWLRELVQWMEFDDVGIVGAKLLYPDQKVQHAGVVIGMQGIASHIFWGVTKRYFGIFGCVEWYRDYSAVTGACLLTSRDIHEQIGGFDERFKIAFGDVDYCLRVRELNRRIVFTPYAQLYHYEGQSRGFHIPEDDLRHAHTRFSEDVKKGDPYYNVNFSATKRIPRFYDPSEFGRYELFQRVCGIEAITSS